MKALFKSILRSASIFSKKPEPVKDDGGKKLLQSPLVSDRLTEFPREYVQFMVRTCLHPVSGLFNYAKTRTLHSLKMAEPSIDISCGDGSTTFIMLGGEFAADGRTPIRFPKYKYTYGTDYNQKSLDAASALAAHRTLIHHDNAAPVFPLQDGQFRFVYHNALYFLKDPVSFLKKIHGAMHEDGIGLFQVWTDKFYSVYDKMGKIFSPEMINEESPFTLTDTFHSGYSVQQWKDIFTRAGFRIQLIESALPDVAIIEQLVIENTLCLRNDYWRLLGEVSPKTQYEIRKEWVEKNSRFFYPCVTEDALRIPIEDATYLSFHVTR